jgi:hypothetical protein
MYSLGQFRSIFFQKKVRFHFPWYSKLNLFYSGGNLRFVTNMKNVNFGRDLLTKMCVDCIQSNLVSCTKLLFMFHIQVFLLIWSGMEGNFARNCSKIIYEQFRFNRVVDSEKKIFYFPIGSNVTTLFCGSYHLGFPISQNTNLC